MGAPICAPGALSPHAQVLLEVAIMAFGFGLAFAIGRREGRAAARRRVVGAWEHDITLRGGRVS